MKPGPRLTLATALLLTLIWGTTWSAIRVGLTGIPPLSGVAVRFLLAGLALAVVARIMGAPWWAGPGTWVRWLAHGLLCFCISYGVTYWAEQWVPSGLTSVLFATYSLWVVILAQFLLPEEKLRPRVALGTLTGFLGVVAERVCVRPLARSSPLMTLLATLSLGLVIREAVLIFYPRGADPKPFPRLLPGGGVEVGGVAIRYENLVILVIGFAAMVAVDLIINRTRMGAAIRAVAQDPEAAQMMGVPLDRTVDATFFLGSGLAAVAGILSGFYYSEVHFIMGVTGGVIGFSAAAIGGLGNVYGAIVGGLLFGVLQTTAAALIPRGSEFRDVVAFAVVMLFLVARPSGLLGEKSLERV